jgi:hypothetical protein
MAQEKNVLFNLITREFGSDKWDKLSEKQRKVNKSTKEVTASGRMLEGNMERVVQVTRRKTRAGGQETIVNDTLLKQNERFQMEYLGLMFAGMALSRTMAGLTETSKEWLGINEIMSTTMGVVTLPATMDLLEKGILPLSEALMNLPEPMQRAIGYAALFGEGFGSALSVLGQTVLALSSLKIAFPGVYAAITSTVGAVTSLTFAFNGLVLGMAAIAFYKYINELARFSEAWDDLGQSVETTSEIVGQKGQMTRTIEKKIPEQELDIDLNKIIEDKYGPTTTIKPNLTTVDWDLSNIENTTQPEKKSVFNRIGNFVGGLFGSRAVGGTIPENGLYNLHQGERVLRPDEVGQNGQTINISYNITASSMQEFEQKLRESERRITSDIRRQVR